MKANRSPRLRLRAALALTAALVLALSLCAAWAETPAPTPVAYENNNEDNNYNLLFALYAPTSGETSKWLDELKTKLYENGYFGTTEPDWGCNYLDDATLLAIKQFCLSNEINEYFDTRGLTYGAWYRITSGDFINLNDPPTAEEAPRYANIPLGQGGTALQSVVNRLWELGYIDNRDHPMYDYTVRDAIEEFGKNNGFPTYYDDDPEGTVRDIEPSVQQVLAETQELVPRPQVTPNPDPRPRVVRYFLEPVDVFGLEVSRLAVWCVGLVVLIACVLAIIYFFVPSDKQGAKNLVRFAITYNGMTQEVEAQITKELKIGRGIGKFPLDLNDASVSRKHCDIYYRNGALMLRDHSTYGTLVNGVMVKDGETMLNSGDVLKIGEHIVEITF